MHIVVVRDRGTGGAGGFASKFLAGILAVALSALSVAHAAQTGTARGDVNMRQAATRASPVVTVLKKGMTVDVVGEEAGFYKVKTEDGSNGYVSARFLDVTAAPDPAPVAAVEPAPAPEPVVVAQALAPAASDTTELETIEVTGSRIRQVDLETAQPVVFITREDIEKQGFNGIADILQNLSAAGNPALSRASPLSAGENVGGSFISLRGVGAQRTLVLVNGKRLGISTSGFQDISVIPLAMVERIEILKDGASSIYGSDAMGGVINVITRSKHEGLYATYYIGQYDEGDGQIDRYDFVVGTAGPRGNIAVGMEYAEEAVVRAADREFAAFPQGAKHQTRNWTTVGQYGGFVAPANTPGFATGTRVLTDPANPGDPRLITSYIAQNQDGGCTAPGSPAGCTVAGSPLHKSNTNQQTDLRTPLQRKSLFLAGTYELEDNLRFVTDIAYTDRESSRTVAGFPYQGTTANNTPISIDSYFNPLGNFSSVATKQAIPSWWRRTWEVPRVSRSELDILRVTGAFKGDFDAFTRRFDWDTSYLYSSNNVIQSSYGNLNFASVRAAVGPSFLNASGQVQCGTALVPIDFATCQPWNPFLHAGQSGAGGLTNNKALQDFLMQEEHSTGRTTTNILSTGITGGIVDLPAGMLSAALGIERREEVGAFVPDALSVSGGSTNLGAKPTRGGYDVNEIFGELAMPLVANVPAVHDLRVSLAMRYSDFNTFGGVKRGKALLEYRPIDELLARATYSEGFRAPTIADLFAGGSQTFSFYTDPCDPLFGSSATNAAVAARCDADIGNFPSTLGSYTSSSPDPTGTFRQLRQGFVPVNGPNQQTPVAFFQGAGNPDLQPESSYSKTVGLVWSSSFVDGLTMSLDWWTIRINNTIVTDTPTSILSDCYVQGIQARCAGFTRDLALGYVNTFNFGSRNAGFREHEGVDYDLHYAFKIGNWDWLGNYVFNWQNTYLIKQVFKTTNAANVIESPEVTFANSAGTTHRIRSNANLTWTLGAFGANWGARYYSHLREQCLNKTLFPEECNEPGYVDERGIVSASGINRNGSNIFHDVQMRYNTPWNGTLSLGANNVFDHLGQQMYSQPDANVSYNGEFDIGRFVYAKYQHRF